MRPFYQHNVIREQCKIRHSLTYKLHFHHHVEVVYMLKGKCTAIVEGVEHLLLPGDILTVFPNQQHEYIDAEGELFFITIFKPEMLTDFKDIFYNMVPESNVYHSENKNQLLHDIAVNLPVMFLQEKKYRDQIYKGLLSVFFGELFSIIALKKTSSADLSTVKVLLGYCNDNYLGEITLESAANALHVSKYYISHLFNDKLKVSFNDYINSLRTADAVAMIESGVRSVTEIAQKCGFNTVRTFNRAFKSIYGMTPSEYKKSLSNKE